MHSTGCEAGQGVHQGGEDGGKHHQRGADHGVRLYATSIALSEHDYVMADIKKEVADLEEDENPEPREVGDEEEDFEDEGEGEEEDDLDDGYEEQEGEERWFNLSQLAEVLHCHKNF